MTHTKAIIRTAERALLLFQMDTAPLAMPRPMNANAEPIAPITPAEGFLFTDGLA